nr:MAG: hypothetical protein A2V48_01270 [Candidatus Amesbacteria bacterium RBG_19FT_COMBO_48_16]
MNLSKFIEDLASCRPTPGGGAAAAVAGAMAAALVEMVAALPPPSASGASAARVKFKAQSAKLRKRLLELADEDCLAFEGVMAAYKLPKENRERGFEIEKALKKATEVPLETMKAAGGVEKLARKMVEKGNKNAVSDAKSAVYLAQAAQKSARENVEINQQSLAKLNLPKDL